MLSYDDIFHLTDVPLKYCGLYGIFAEDKSKYKWSSLIFWIGTLNLHWSMVMEINQFIDLLTNEFNLEAFLVFSEVSPCFIESFFATVATLLMYGNRVKITELSDELRRMWPKDNQEVISETMAPTRKLCMAYSVVINSCATMFVAVPICIFFYSLVFMDETVLQFPFWMKYPFDPQINWGVYFLLYVSQIYGGTFTSAGASGIECVFSILIANICMHFRILYMKIQSIDPKETDDLVTVQKVKEAALYHQKIIDMSQVIGDVFAPAVFTEMIGGSALMCLTIFSTLICPLEKVPKNVLFFTSVTLQIFVMAYYGNKLISEAESIAEAAYNSKWMENNKHHVFAVKMFQIRASKPVAVSVMGFFDLSLASFTSIVSAAMSYFTLLRQLMDEHD